MGVHQIALSRLAGPVTRPTRWIGSQEIPIAIASGRGPWCTPLVLKRLAWLGLPAALFCCAAPATAEGVDDATRRAARTLGVSGVEAYEAGDYATASVKLEKAYRALSAPSLGLWSARALAKLNRLVEAAERYQEVLRLDAQGGEAAVQRQAKSDAAEELARLSPQIPNLVISVEGAEVDSVQVKVDGAVLASSLIGENRPVNPGKHVVEASRGQQHVQVAAEVATGETKPVVLRFQAGAPSAAAPSPGAAAAPAAEPVAPVPGQADDGSASKPTSTRRTLGFVAIGVGGAGLALGGVATVIAVGKKGKLDDSQACSQNRCLPSEQGNVDSYKMWRQVSSIGLIAGVAVAGAGVLMVLTTPKSQSQTALQIGPGSVTFGRSF